jgi:rifampicin phosphotransferase
MLVVGNRQAQAVVRVVAVDDDGQVRVDLPFEPPGPGTWQLDTVHFPRPATRYWAETQPEPFRRGVAEFTRYYGMLLGGMRMSYVNGFAYSSVTPVSDDEVPERLQRAEEVFERKLWREQLREWDEVAKPAAIGTHRDLQSVDPEALSDPELSAYLTRCHDHHAQMIYQHMRFTGAAMIPVGDLLAHLADWTSVPPSDVLGMMRGAAPVSAGASSELDRLVTAFAEDAAAREILQSEGDPAQVLDTLRSLRNDVSKELSGYLNLVGA